MTSRLYLASIFVLAMTLTQSIWASETLPVHFRFYHNGDTYFQSITQEKETDYLKVQFSDGRFLENVNLDTWVGVDGVHQLMDTLLEIANSLSDDIDAQDECRYLIVADLAEKEPEALKLLKEKNIQTQMGTFMDLLQVGITKNCNSQKSPVIRHLSLIESAVSSSTYQIVVESNEIYIGNHGGRWTEPYTKTMDVMKFLIRDKETVKEYLRGIFMQKNNFAPVVDNYLKK